MKTVTEQLQDELKRAGLPIGVDERKPFGVTIMTVASSEVGLLLSFLRRARVVHDADARLTLDDMVHLHGTCREESAKRALAEAIRAWHAKEAGEPEFTDLVVGALIVGAPEPGSLS